ncbi:Mandelate racemase/muconate lactonizing protein [Sphingobium chlorophenolicum L-1]|uniref:Mandelate racemase/muconate lactonizing protein n=1 Tax=Sphingobium chlorophenolicum L-1 TaxID=690566 RepID=F6F1Y9_SPHCR|nr:enolase C-terminal domain-like protein [Sphingobium chlorophenolicum]AEG51555.1 Mandelate racemase/muconate lactonizing protein [Sphingobium chlorophenolicum L-1]
MRIVAAHVAECALPLPRPVTLGPTTITKREFIALRLVAEDGSAGDAITYPRNGPIYEALQRMVPALLGSCVTDRRATIDGYLARHVNNRAAYMKAASLADIALWDLAAKQAGLPLHRMLGAARHEIPVMIVAGYRLEQRTVEDLCAEVERRCEEGYERIKIMLSGTDRRLDERVIAQAYAIAGDRLCADAHWAFDGIADAAFGLRGIDGIGLRFIEDPFGPHRAGLYGDFSRMLKTPLASGEDLPDPQALMELSRHIDILRIDVTTCGGVSAANALMAMADLSGKTVLPHVFLPVHAQLAGAHRAVASVELIPDEAEACPMFDLLEGRPDIRNGMLTIDETPGAGFRLRWPEVVRYASKPILTFKSDRS